MKIVKILATTLVWLLILALMITPLVMVFKISRAEMEEYATPTVPILQQSAVGKGVRATRQDVKEYIDVPSLCKIGCSILMSKLLFRWSRSAARSR